jgi:hypothetical protein
MSREPMSPQEFMSEAIVRAIAIWLAGTVLGGGVMWLKASRLTDSPEVLPIVGWGFLIGGMCALFYVVRLAMRLGASVAFAAATTAGPHVARRLGQTIGHLFGSPIRHEASAEPVDRPADGHTKIVVMEHRPEEVPAATAQPLSVAPMTSRVNRPWLPAIGALAFIVAVALFLVLWNDEGDWTSWTNFLNADVGSRLRRECESIVRESNRANAGPERREYWIRDFVEKRGVAGR